MSILASLMLVFSFAFLPACTKEDNGVTPSRHKESKSAPMENRQTGFVSLPIPSDAKSGSNEIANTLTESFEYTDRSGQNRIGEIYSATDADGFLIEWAVSEETLKQSGAGLNGIQDYLESDDINCKKKCQNIRNGKARALCRFICWLCCGD